VVAEDKPVSFAQPRQFVVARVKISQGKYREALREVEAINAKTSEEESVKLILLGQSYEGLYDMARAFPAYKKARPLTPLGLLREGVCHYKMGDPLLARSLLRAYCKVEPGNAEAYYYLFLCGGRLEAEKAIYAGRVIALDGPNGYWSTQLLKAIGQEKGEETKGAGTTRGKCGGTTPD
jgi:tetratricopeptide (TPR) repeat protein